MRKDRGSNWRSATRATFAAHRALVGLGLAVTVLLALFAWPATGGAQQPAAMLSLDRQIERDGVIRGSALENLIRNNQQIQLLNQVETAKEQARLPHWLKIYFRKQHPAMKSRPNDPTQGYPAALENVYHWMITHQDLQPSPAPQPRRARAALTVGANLRISGETTSSCSESDIRVNFTNPNLIIAASNAIRGDGRQAQFYSTDGGTTWGQTSLPLVGSDQFHSDPTVDWTSDGTAWATTMGIDGSIMRMRAYKSVDQGATWTFDAILSGQQTEVDKQLMWVDHSPTSPHHDNIYVIWHNGPDAFINRRTGPAG